MRLNPLPTIYNNQEFRSSLEARWALYFDLIGASWHYEPDGYRLPNGNYLPDFLIETSNGKSIYVEVKPDMLSRMIWATDIGFDFAERTHETIVCLIGYPSTYVFASLTFKNRIRFHHIAFFHYYFYKFGEPYCYEKDRDCLGKNGGACWDARAQDPWFYGEFDWFSYCASKAKRLRTGELVNINT